MENSKVRETSPYAVAGGIAAVIIFMLLTLGLLARTQMPVDTNAMAASNAANDTANSEPAEDADSSDEPTADTTESAETEPSADSSTDATGDSEEESTDIAESTENEATDAGETQTTSSSESASQTDAAEAAESSGAAESSEATESEDVAAGGSDKPEASLPTVLLPEDELVVAFATGGCSACHTIPNIAGAVGQLGPDLTNIGTTAAERVEGVSAVEYIRQSIVEPGAYFIEECPMGPCGPDLDQTLGLAALSETEVNGIITYLLSLTDDGQMIAEAGAPESSSDAEPSDEAAPQEAAEEPVESTVFDMEAVSSVVTKGTCGACHVIPGVDGAAGIVGPDLTGIGAAAATRIDGYTAEEYLYESIVDPNAFIAPACPAGDCFANVMLPNLVDLLTEDDIDLLVQYLGTLQ